MFAGFVGASLFVRVSALGIREGWWPFGNVRVGGRHIHHFVPGILIAFGSGAAALMTESESVETTLAVPFGVGVGLTFDEAALLLDLRDVYWSREGILSVQVTLAVASFLGAVLVGMRMLRRGEERATDQGRIPWVTPTGSSAARPVSNSDRILRFASGPVGRRGERGGMTYVLIPAVGDCDACASEVAHGPASSPPSQTHAGLSVTTEASARCPTVRSASLDCPGDHLAGGRSSPRPAARRAGRRGRM